MYDITNLPTSVEIGLTGEHVFRTFEIDMSAWMAIMPNGVPSIVHIRPGEGDDDAYIVATTFDSDTNVLSWTVSRSDLGTAEGVGTAQVWLEEAANYTLAKRGMSATFATIIRDSIGDDSATVPAAQTPWIQQMTQLKTNTVAAALRAEAAQAAAESVASGVSEYTSQAEQHAQNADSYSNISEAYAKGTVDGVAVDEGEIGYQDNSKYYKEQAETAATAAAGSATTASQQALAAGNSMSQAYQYSQAAATSAQNAASSASAAETSATNSLESAGVAEAAKGVAQTSASEAAASASQAAQTVAGIEDAGDVQVQRVSAQGAAERAAIVAEGEEVLDSIPADYTELSNQVKDLSSDLITLNKTASTTSTGTGDYFVNYPISAGDRIKAVSTVGVNIHTRATKTGANIEELGYVNGTKIFTASQNAEWLKMYFVGAGTISFENLNKRVPVLETDIAELKQNVSQAENIFDDAITSNINYLEQTTVHNNNVWGRTTNQYGSNQYCNAYDPIPIKNGVTYYYKNIYAYFTLIRKASDGTFAPMSDDATNPNSGTFTADFDGSICITVPNSITGFLFTDSEELYNSNLINTYYTPNKLDVSGKIIRVGALQEYTTLRSGIAEAIKYKNALVLVDAGTYDLCEEFASEINANQAGVQFGIGLGNSVHVLFEAGAKVVADYTGGVQNITSYFNPFFPVGDGCFTLENADISVKNTRYCVHDEWSGHTGKRVVKYINCRMEMDNTSAVINWYPQCIGGGNGASDYISIENCWFKSKFFETYTGGVVSYHNNNSGTGTMKSDVHVSGCYFSDKATFRCSYSGAATAVSRAYVNNCSLGSALVIGQEQSGGTAPENYELIPWMNELRSA